MTNHVTWLSKIRIYNIRIIHFNQIFIYNMNTFQNITGWQKKKIRTHIFLTEMHKFNSSLFFFFFFFFFRIRSRFCVWKIVTIVFTNMSWSTKEKTLELFCFIFVEVIKKCSWVLFSVDHVDYNLCHWYKTWFLINFLLSQFNLISLGLLGFKVFNLCRLFNAKSIFM